ncbi:MAG: hypothetical protein K0S46_685 [Moraxellaceae bacterium]|jgi:outer membrane protein assembly factor BamC|nr:hypothetical protein [Moraxellaceae bacterium]
MTHRLLGLFVLVVLSGCSGLRDRGDEYRSAKEIPPLVIPQGAEARPIKPLYPIPPGPVPETWPKKFQVPAPKPLKLDEAVGVQPGAASPAVVDKPILTQDGNGYPLLSVTGDFNAVWDRIEEVLRMSGVRISDRDQRVGLYFLSLDDETGKGVPYQLRITRGQSAYTLTLQKDDDTLAPKQTTSSLFEAIVSRWPGLPEVQ